jgi:hypothetical protein
MTTDIPTVVLTGNRLLTEQLHDLMAVLASRGDRLPADAVATLARLVTAVSALQDLHTTDTRGRCRLCRAKPRKWSRPKHCSVHATLETAMRSPFGLIVDDTAQHL